MAYEEQQTQPERDSHVAVQLSGIYSELERLDHQITRLKDRLVNVLRDSVPPDSSKPSVVDEAIVPLANEMRNHRGRISAAADRILDLIERIEL